MKTNQFGHYKEVTELRTTHFFNGKIHRLDGPAIIDTDGTEFWYKEGRYHRLDGPAISWADGTEHWYKEGERHRLDGPAIIYGDSIREHFINGKKLIKEEFILRTQ